MKKNLEKLYYYLIRIKKRLNSFFCLTTLFHNDIIYTREINFLIKLVSGGYNKK